MKINFNRENITKYMIIGGVATLTLITGVRFSSDAKKNSKPINTKDDKQYEVIYETTDSDNENGVYFAPKGYPIEGMLAVRDPYVLENKDGLSEYTLDGISYKAPEGYYLEIVKYASGDVQIRAIRQVREVHLASLVNEIGTDGVVYSYYEAPEGYTLENDDFGKMIAVRVMTEYTEPIIVENQKSITRK